MLHHRWQTCITCPGFELRDGAIIGQCSARNVPLYKHEAAWTTCSSAGQADPFPSGPLFAIVQAVEDGETAYHRMPYYQGKRPLLWIEQHSRDLSTYVQVETDDAELRFACVEDYLVFWETHSRKTGA